MAGADVKEGLTQHVEAMRRFALTLARNADTADELVQTALLKAIERAGTWDRSRPMRPWLFGILRNTFISELRHHRVRDAALKLHGDMAVTHAAPKQMDQVFLRTVETAMGSLAPEKQEVLFLVSVEGLSYQEAASVIGIPVGTVMSRLSSARQALRNRLERGDRARLQVVR
jgi:RNA polymerase sigma-70 factor, ECF subfamily